MKLNGTFHRKYEVARELQKPDLVYGIDVFSKLPRAAQELAQTRIFQELLAKNHAGFNIPSHSRGEHAIGVAYLASVLFNKNCPGSLEEFVVAALLHDIGHYAFSHTAEIAFPQLCHKHRTEDIILNHPEVRKIMARYGLDAEVVRSIALDKFDGNPFTVKRGSGKLSLDHIDNTFRDLLRIMVRLPKDVIFQFIKSLEVDEDGLIRGNSEEFRQMFTRLSIAQNIETVFTRRGILIDGLSCILLKKAVDYGLISMDQLEGTDLDVISTLASASAPPEIRQLTGFIYADAQHLTDDQMDLLLVRRIPEIEERSELNDQIFDIYTSLYTPTGEDFDNYKARVERADRLAAYNELERLCLKGGLDFQAVRNMMLIRSGFKDQVRNQVRTDVAREFGVDEEDIYTHTVRGSYFNEYPLAKGDSGRTDFSHYRKRIEGDHLIITRNVQDLLNS